VAVDDLPGPVVTFLNVIGVPWPYLNEDDVHHFAALVREFGQAVQKTHQDATETLGAFAQAYQSSATEQMRSGWAELSANHVQPLVEGAGVLADALEVGAGFIVAQKVEAIAELAGMAGAFLADQAASVATFGLAETAVPLIIEAGKKLLETLKQQIIQYLTGQIIEAAAKPLFEKIEQALSGLDWSQTSAAAAPGAGFSLDFEEAAKHLSILRDHAETMRGHAEKLRSGLQGLEF
jgi:hypothetical protein